MNIFVLSLVDSPHLTHVTCFGCPLPPVLDPPCVSIQANFLSNWFFSLAGPEIGIQAVLKIGLHSSEFTAAHFLLVKAINTTRHIMYMFDLLICFKPAGDNGWVSYYFRKKLLSGNFYHFKIPTYAKGMTNRLSAMTLEASACHHNRHSQSLSLSNSSRLAPADVYHMLSLSTEIAYGKHRLVPTLASATDRDLSI